MGLINLTEHVLNVIGYDVPASGTVARIEDKVMTSRIIHGFEVKDIKQVKIINLPDYEDGSKNIYIVSRPCAQALLTMGVERDDVVFPGEAIRDEKGMQIGCTGFYRLSLIYVPGGDLYSVS